MSTTTKTALIFLLIFLLTSCAYFHPSQKEAFERMEAIYEQTEFLFDAFSTDFDKGLISGEQVKVIRKQNGSFDHPALTTSSARSLIEKIDPKFIVINHHDEKISIRFIAYTWGGGIGGAEWGYSFSKPFANDFDNAVEIDDNGNRRRARFESCTEAIKKISANYIKTVQCKLQTNWVAYYFGD